MEEGRPSSTALAVAMWRAERLLWADPAKIFEDNACPQALRLRKRDGPTSASRSAGRRDCAEYQSRFLNCSSHRSGFRANELSNPFPSLCPTLFHRFRQPLSSLVGDAAACLCIRGGQLRIRGSPRPGEHSVPRSIRLRVRFLQGCYSSIEPLPFISQIFDDFLDVQLSSFASSDPPLL